MSVANTCEITKLSKERCRLPCLRNHKSGNLRPSQWPRRRGQGVDEERGRDGAPCSCLQGRCPLTGSGPGSACPVTLRGEWRCQGGRGPRAPGGSFPGVQPAALVSDPQRLGSVPCSGAVPPCSPAGPPVPGVPGDTEGQCLSRVSVLGAQHGPGPRRTVRLMAELAGPAYLMTTQTCTRVSWQHLLWALCEQDPISSSQSRRRVCGEAVGCLPRVTVTVLNVSR